MKKIFYLFVVLIITLPVILWGASPAAAAQKTEFSCTETFIETIDPGVWTFPDGNLHIRGMVQLLDESAPDPRDIGENTVLVNANWNANGIGPMWGTFTFETNEGGLWQGTWAGLMTELGPKYTAAGDGYGMYSGMKIWVDVNYGECRVTFLSH
jgi:hypothetical protein